MNIASIDSKEYTSIKLKFMIHSDYKIAASNIIQHFMRIQGFAYTCNDIENSVIVSWMNH